VSQQVARVHLEIVDIEEALVLWCGDEVITQLQGRHGLWKLLVGIADVVEQMEQPLRHIDRRVGVQLTELQSRTDFCNLSTGRERERDRHRQSQRETERDRHRVRERQRQRVSDERTKACERKRRRHLG
jgi:hypothetical protein